MTMLFAWLWQGLALVAAASIALRLCRRLDSASRYAIWWGALLAVLALPLIPALTTSGDDTAAMTVAATAAESPSTPLAIPTPPDWVVAIVVGAWLGSVVVGLLRLAHGVSAAARLRRDSLEVAAGLQRRLPLWTAARGAGRPISLRHAPWVRSACVAGGLRPAIVLPSAWLDTLDLHALDQVVIHEQAHVARFDDVARLGEAVIECFVGWHPAVRIALARLDIEREAACDDRVVLCTGEATRYATCLAEAAATLCGGTLQAQLLLRVFGRVSALQVRVARILDRSRRRRARLEPAAVATAVLLLSVSVLAAGQLDPILVFERATVKAGFSPTVPTRSIGPSSVESPPPTAVAESTAVTRRPPSQSSSPLALPQSGTAASPPAGAPAAEGKVPPSATATQASATVLTSRTLDVTFYAPAEPATHAPVEMDQGPPSPWSAAAQGGVALGNAAGRGGVALGSGSKKAGSAIGGFFARSGRAIAKSF